MKTKKLVLAGLMTALVFIMTALLKMALPGGGYANLGDIAVLLSGVLLEPGAAFLASGLGSALSDFLWLPIYTPLTFCLKGVMALIVSLARKHDRPFLAAAIPAELLMIVVYYAADAWVFNPLTALSALGGNAAQALIGCTAAAVLTRILKNNQAIQRIEHEKRGKKS